MGLRLKVVPQPFRVRSLPIDLAGDGKIQGRVFLPHEDDTLAEVPCAVKPSQVDACAVFEAAADIAFLDGGTDAAVALQVPDRIRTFIPGFRGFVGFGIRPGFASVRSRRNSSRLLAS